MKKHHHPFRIFASIMLVAAILLLLDSEGVGIWVSRLTNPAFKKSVAQLSQNLTAFATDASLTYPRQTLRERLFAPFRDLSFAKPKTTDPVPAALGEETTASEMNWLTYLGKNVDKDKVFSMERPLQVLLIGDSLAQSNTPWVFYEKIKNNPCINFTPKGVVSSTLSNPSFYDWPHKIFEIFENKIKLDGKPYDVIIVFIGGNDAQSIPMEGHDLAWGTPEWETEHKNRIRSFAKSLTDNAKQVYWLSLPPMGKQGYAQRIEHVNQNYKEVLTEFSAVKWIDTAPIVGDKNGQYTKTKIIDGMQKTVREADHIHLTADGARILVDAILKTFNETYVFSN
jgi:hypothetical protein